MRPRLLFYCQHSLGLGHLARSLELAKGLTSEFDVVLLNGGRFPEGTRVPPGITVVNLPPLGHDEANRLVSHDPSLTVEAACEQRRTAVLDALDRVDPAVLLIEMYPFGRKKFEFELVPLLDEATTRGAPRPVIVCSVRDILVSARKDQAAYDERCSQRANRWFDAVLVHADPVFARLEGSFHPGTPLQVPVHHTGFVAPVDTPDREDRTAPLRRVLVSSGGGMVGEPLVRAAVEAHEDVFARTGLTTTVIAGPFLPDAVWHWLAEQAACSRHLEAIRRVDDLCLEMRRSAVSVSQGGYNTTMDLLRAHVPAVVVPFGDGGENEQRRRTERLAELGVVRLLAPEAMTGALLTAEIAAALDAPPAPVTFDLTGAAVSAALIKDLTASRALAGARS